MTRSITIRKSQGIKIVVENGGAPAIYDGFTEMFINEFLMQEVKEKFDDVSEIGVTIEITFNPPKKA